MKFTKKHKKIFLVFLLFMIGYLLFKKRPVVEGHAGGHLPGAGVDHDCDSEDSGCLEHQYELDNTSITADNERVTYGGYYWRTLDEGINPEVPGTSGQNTGTYMNIPAGYGIAPNDGVSRAIAGSYNWETECIVLDDGSSWQTQPNTGERCENETDNDLQQDGDNLRYTVSGERKRVLIYGRYGCTNRNANNYNPEASVDDGNCIIYGCTDGLAPNFDENATHNDGNCEAYACISQSGNCGENATCVNDGLVKPEGYRCDCNTGYTGDGTISGTGCTECLAGNETTKLVDNIPNVVTSGATTCSACGEGFFDNDRNSSTACVSHSIVENCPIGKGITVGTRLIDKQCTECVVGKYSDGNNDSSCTQCPDSSTTNSTGSTAVTACLCPAGKSGTITAQSGEGSSCSDCSIDTYTSTAGAATCTTCPGGSITNGTEGSIAVTDCLCPAGKTGTITVQGSSCSDCLINTYKSTVGDTACIACPGVSITNSTGSTALADCLCPAGKTGTITTQSGEGSTCSDCTGNTYKPTAGTGSCIACGSGLKPNAAHTACEPCPAPTVGTGGTCTITCTDGEQPNTARTQCEDCPAPTVGTDGTCTTTCGSGQKPNTARTQCVNCPAPKVGTNGSCPTTCGSGQKPNTARTQCDPCPAPKVGTNGSCPTTCTDGKQPNTARTRCVNCPSGRVGRGGSCPTQCPHGQQPNAARTECENCPAGKAGSGGRCTDCAAGTYSATEGSIACITCADGLVQPNTRQTSCSICPTGTESNNDRTGCAGSDNGGYRWRFGDENQSCSDVCGNRGCTDGNWGVMHRSTFNDKLEIAGHSPDDVCTGNRTYTTTATGPKEMGGSCYTKTARSSAGRTSQCRLREADARRLCRCNPAPDTNCEGEWGNWSVCSQACGGGTRRRLYNVTVNQSGNGTSCPHSAGDEESQVCNTGACPDTAADSGATVPDINCEGGWGDWSDCTQDCDGGTKRRVYNVTVNQSGNGADCTSSHGAEETEDCNTYACSTDIKTIANPPTDCSGMAGTYYRNGDANNRPNYTKGDWTISYYLHGSQLRWGIHDGSELKASKYATNNAPPSSGWHEKCSGDWLAQVFTIT